MTPAQLIARDNESRRSWFQLDERRRIQFQALSPADFMDMVVKGELLQDAMVMQAVMGWEGFQEVDILKTGSDESLKFSTDLFRHWYRWQPPELWSQMREAAYAACKESAEMLTAVREKPQP